MDLPTSLKTITPPGSIVNGPLTPPTTDKKPAARVARILAALRDRKNGVSSESPWTVFTLSSKEYHELQDQLEHDEPLGEFVTDKVRYDYNPIWSVFILRMPLIRHENFGSRLMMEILKVLGRLADANIDARPFIEGIGYVTGRMDFNTDNNGEHGPAIHEPDITFAHDDAVFPGVIIEVANSQKRKFLARLADTYILRTNGSVNVVVGLDLDYRKSKEASISIWRLKGSTNNSGEVEWKVEQVVDNQLFRDAEGNPSLSLSSNLKLSLKDFASERVTRGVPDLSIVISSETLCKLLGAAEIRDAKITKRQGDMNLLLQNKRSRSMTPPEELTLSDEEKFKDEEKRVRKKLKREDKSYHEEE